MNEKSENNVTFEVLSAVLLSYGSIHFFVLIVRNERTDTRRLTIIFAFLISSTIICKDFLNLHRGEEHSVLWRTSETSKLSKKKEEKERTAVRLPLSRSSNKLVIIFSQYLS